MQWDARMSARDGGRCYDLMDFDCGLGTQWQLVLLRRGVFRIGVLPSKPMAIASPIDGIGHSAMLTYFLRGCCID